MIIIYILCHLTTHLVIKLLLSFITHILSQAFSFGWSYGSQNFLLFCGPFVGATFNPMDRPLFVQFWVTTWLMDYPYFFIYITGTFLIFFYLHFFTFPHHRIHTIFFSFIIYKTLGVYIHINIHFIEKKNTNNNNNNNGTSDFSCIYSTY